MVARRYEIYLHVLRIFHSLLRSLVGYIVQHCNILYLFATDSVNIISLTNTDLSAGSSYFQGLLKVHLGAVQQRSLRTSSISLP